MTRELLTEWLDESPEHSRAFLEEGLILEATEAICEAMKKRRMSKAALAGRLGTSKAYVTQLLNGNRNMTLRTFARIAFALNLTPEMALKEDLASSKQHERMDRTRQSQTAVTPALNQIAGANPMPREGLTRSRSDERAAARRD